jgi:hypothetical protein
LSHERIHDLWGYRQDTITVDGEAASADALIKRLATVWLPDETVVYIGKATILRSRVKDYIRTPLGGTSRHHGHMGGNWAHALAAPLWLHFAVTENPHRCEKRLLKAFHASTTSASWERHSRISLDASRMLPFANMKCWNDRRRSNGIEGWRWNAKLKGCR